MRAFAAAHAADVVLTTHPRHATTLARQALDDGCGLVVAVGGDGTMNEVAAALAGTEAVLGLVPCGSGDGLGRCLGLHGSVARALKILRTGRPRPIDTGLADGHAFFTAAGLGFESEVAARFNQIAGRGFLRYLTTAASLWHRHEPVDFWIESGGRRLATRAFTLTVANCEQYGNHALIAPGARVDDGLLDLTAVLPVSAWSALPLLARLFTGTLDRAPGVVRLQSAKFVIERPMPGLIHTDGETHAAGTRVEFTLRPRSLRVMAPISDQVELLPADPVPAPSQL